MEYCCKCRKENKKNSKICECDYQEINMFLEYIDTDLGKQFKICECPDKKDKCEYTCDFVLDEISTHEKMYVEVKTVLYGFDNSTDGQTELIKKKEKLHNKTIAQNNNQKICAELISKVIDCCDTDKQDILGDFAVTIPQLQIGTDEHTEFGDQLFQFLSENTFEDKEYCFVYKRKRQNKEIKIPFTRKSNELRELIDENIAFQYDVSGNGNLSAIFERLTDIKNLKRLINQNAQNTSDNKFPETKERKILLNVLRLPQGFELFFDLNIKMVIGQLIEDSEDYKSAADECYLLYYSPDYYDTEFLKDGSCERRPMGEALFVIPLIQGLVNDVIVYERSDN